MRLTMMQRSPRDEVGVGDEVRVVDVAVLACSGRWGQRRVTTVGEATVVLGHR
jgi:hypothetical protein